MRLEQLGSLFDEIAIFHGMRLADGRERGDIDRGVGVPWNGGMDSSRMHIEVRRPWRAGESLFLLGPGGVGKSSLGRELSRQFGWPLIDLDLEFCARIGEIGGFISAHGYERYRAENLALAGNLVSQFERPSVLVTASGFLAAEPGTDDHNVSRQLVGTGYSVTLLPSLDIEAATAIVVERQLTRGFGLRRETEIPKFRKRFGIYRAEGDMLVVGTEHPSQIAVAVQRALEGGAA